MSFEDALNGPPQSELPPVPPGTQRRFRRPRWLRRLFRRRSPRYY